VARIVAGLARPTSGAAHVLGHDVTGAGGDVRAMIGFLPDVPAFYQWMTAPQYLRFAGSLVGLRGDVLDARVAALLDLAGLTGVGTRIGGFSRGMKQRLGVAQALVNAPPAAARRAHQRPRPHRPPRSARHGRRPARPHHRVLLHAHPRRRGTRLRQCSHHRPRAGGRARAHQRAAPPPRRTQPPRRGVDEPRRLAAALEGAAWLRAIEVAEDGGLRLTTDDLEAAQRELPALVARLGLALRHLESDELSLEDVFVDLVEGERR